MNFVIKVMDLKLSMDKDHILKLYLMQFGARLTNLFKSKSV